MNMKSLAFVGELIKNRYLYLLVLPGFIFFIIFNYLPLIGLYFAFVDYHPFAKPYGLTSPFVGLENIKFFLTSNNWIKITLNTLYLNFLFIVTGLLVQIFMAIGLNELRIKIFTKSAQSLMFLPNFISWTVVSVFSVALFATDNGLINGFLVPLGLSPISFYQNAEVWPALLVLLRLWKGVGFGTIIFLATISGIDQEMYEAAKIDGASRIQAIWHITIPLLKTTAIMLFILSVGGIIVGDFGMIYALVGDNPLLRSTTDVIDTFVYRALRIDGNIGMSSAVTLFQSIIGFIMVVGANYITRIMDRDSALF